MTYIVIIIGLPILFVAGFFAFAARVVDRTDRREAKYLTESDSDPRIIGDVSKPYKASIRHMPTAGV